MLIKKKPSGIYGNNELLKKKKIGELKIYRKAAKLVQGVHVPLSVCLLLIFYINIYLF